MTPGPGEVGGIAILPDHHKLDGSFFRAEWPLRFQMGGNIRDPTRRSGSSAALRVRVINSAERFTIMCVREGVASASVRYSVVPAGKSEALT